MKDSPPSPESASQQSLFTSRRRERRRLRSRRAKIAGLLILVVAAGVGGWLWYRSRADATPAGGTLPAAAAAAPAPPAAAATSASEPLPSLDASDAVVRKLVTGLSSHPQLASWLANDKLVHRFVVSVVDVADGRSPEGVLGFLTPQRPFRARDTGSGLSVDPADYHRYDALTATLVSLDPDGLAQLYRRLSPLMDEAYKDLGLHDETFQSVLARAFGRLLAVSFPDQPPAVVHNSVAYSYQSPALENLSPAAKHLLRFGPENGRKVQAKLKEIAAAIGIVPVAPARGAG